MEIHRLDLRYCVLWYTACCLGGVFVRSEDGAVRFETAPPPDDDEIEALLRVAVQRLLRILRPGEPEDDAPDALTLGYADAVRALPTAEPEEGFRKKPHSAFIDGFSLHAGVHLHENDREGLERLLRYGARPPFSLGAPRKA